MLYCLNTGIDYHFYHNETYFTTEERKIKKLTIEPTTNMDGTIAALDLISTDVLLNRPAEVSLRSIAVDWVNDELYWIENLEGDTSRVRELG